MCDIFVLCSPFLDLKVSWGLEFYENKNNCILMNYLKSRFTLKSPTYDMTFLPILIYLDASVEAAVAAVVVAAVVVEYPGVGWKELELGLVTLSTLETESSSSPCWREPGRRPCCSRASAFPGSGPGRAYSDLPWFISCPSFSSHNSRSPLQTYLNK